MSSNNKSYLALGLLLCGTLPLLGCGGGGGGASPSAPAPTAPPAPASLPAAPVLSAAVPADDPAWVRVASPKVVYLNDGSSGALAFAALVPDAQAYILAIARGVAQKLYKSPADVPAFDRMELRIREWNGGPDEPADGVAWKAGDPQSGIIVNVNTRYLQKFSAGGGNMAEEVRGILFHEMTHAYQHYENMDPAGLESMADLVRYQAGYIDKKARQLGGSYRDPYKTGAFFFAYLVEQRGFKDFAYCFNATAKPGSSFPWSWENAIGACAGGGNAAQLWAEYQAWLPGQA